MTKADIVQAIDDRLTGLTRIDARRVVTFHTSDIVKEAVNRKLGAGAGDASTKAAGAVGGNRRT
jgi:hypothetical protein